MEKKDYRLLRPFDLEAAKRGVAICGAVGVAQRTYISGPDSNGRICVADEDGRFAIGHPCDYRMAPMAWVEGKPVYKGDVLFWKHDGKRVIASRIQKKCDDEFLFFEGDGGNICICGPQREFLNSISTVTWEPPKVKRGASRHEVFAVVSSERSYQDEKWGTIEQHPHEVGAWLTIIRKLLSDAEEAYASQRGDEGALDELRKVVAVGVACMEQHGAVARK